MSIFTTIDRKLVLVLILAAVSLYINVGSYGLIETSDARYAEISAEMVSSGDYLNPTLLGIGHYHKPPLTYQITTLGYHLFGVNAFGARFFVQIAFLLQLLMVYQLSHALFKNRKTALWSALIYFSFPITLISTRNLTTDPYLATFVLASILMWVYYRKSGKTRFLYLFTLSLALGFLTKGPVDLIIPAMFIVFYNRYEKPKRSFSYHHILAWILFIAIGGSWFFYLIQSNPVFLDYFVGHHVIDRFSTNAFNRSEPFWYYFAVAPVVGMPWILVFPFLLWRNRRKIMQSKLLVAFLAGIVLSFLFFSAASSKLIPYILPMFPLMAILIAQLFFQEEILGKTYKGIILGFGTILALGFIVSPFIQTGLSIPNETVLMGLSIIAGYFILQSIPTVIPKSRLVYFSFFVGVVLLVGSGFIMSRNQIEINSTSPITDFIKANNLNERQILVYNRIVPSIAFNLHKPIVSLYDGDSSLNREVQFEKNEDWRNNLVNLQNDRELENFKETLTKNTVFILYKHKISEKRKWILQNYTKVKDFGKWQVYY